LNSTAKDWLQVAQGFAPGAHLPPMTSLLSLRPIENETLEGAYNQYKSPRLIVGAILKHGDRIKKRAAISCQRFISRSSTAADMLEGKGA